MPKKMGEILVERGVISKDKLKAALDRQAKIRTYIGEVLARSGVSRIEIDDAAAEQLRSRGNPSHEAES